MHASMHPWMHTPNMSNSVRFFRNARRPHSQKQDSSDVTLGTRIGRPGSGKCMQVAIFAYLSATFSQGLLAI
jgi:hypothetical protein